VLAATAGAAAAVAAALARPASTEAAVGDPVRAGQSTDAAGKTTTLTNSSNLNHTLRVTQGGRSTAVTAKANKGTGGRFTNAAKDKYALIATNNAAQQGAGGAILATGNSNAGVVATTYRSEVNAIHADQSGHAGVAILATNSSSLSTPFSAGAGIRALTHGATYADINGGGTFDAAAGQFAGPVGIIGASNTGSYGVVGRTTNGIGVYGWSGFWGVYGQSTVSYGVVGSSSTSSGVWGDSLSGYGVRGTSTSGYAVYAGGRLGVQQYVDVAEIADPAAPSANQARLFVRDSGGKTQLCVRFPTGVVQVIKTEP
jgi:hypothetical protein